MTKIQKFGVTTESAKYVTCQMPDGKWYFHPTDSEWLAFNANDSFSAGYSSEESALQEAELHEKIEFYSPAESEDDCEKE